ncbi:MAG: hypothetical protein NVSMB2_00020 [Chloroflexota bacterium]
MIRNILLLVGAALLVVGFAVSFSQWGSGAQPWGQLLGDNFWFARTLPFSLGFAVILGYWRAANWTDGTARRSDGAIRRFARSTIVLHAVAGIALVALVATGGWQYLKGLLDAETPIYMGTVYRIHYIAATVLIIVSVTLATDWLLRGENALGLAGGQRMRAWRGLSHELPRPIGHLLGYLMGMNMQRPGPATEQFTFYERAVSFPTWNLAIGLIIITGVIKAMRYIYPIPGDVLYWTSAAHVGAGVLLALKVLDHLRYVLAPSRWPLMTAMWTGWIPEGYVRRFHPAWYARLETQPTTHTVVTPPPAAQPIRAGSAGGAAS